MIFIYLKIAGKELNIKFLLILFFLYSTDVFHLFFKPTIQNPFCIYLNLVVYVLLLNEVVKNIGTINFKKFDNILVLSILIIFSFLGYIFYVANALILDQNIKYYSIFLAYCILLFILGVIITIKFVIKTNISNTFLIITFACFVLSDVFYLFNLIYSDIIIFKYILYLPQFLTYYFLLNYELNRYKISKF